MTRSDERPLAAFDDSALSNISHQLRTPLSLIVGYAELLRERRDDEEIRRAAPERILTAAEELSSMVDDLLVVLAIESNVLYVELAPTELEAAVTGALGELERTVERYSVTTSCVAWPRVSADADHLRQILRNLLLNAFRLSQVGGEIRIEVGTDGGFAAVTVSDTASALSDTEVAGLFDRLFPLPGGTDHVRTTGLELYKVRRLVELQGGQVAAARRDGGGTAVTFTIPLA